MIDMERPDLSQVSPEVLAYIEALEAKLAGGQTRAAAVNTFAEPSEPPTTINIVTLSRDGLVKRTPRHLYGRQRRGGMGVFDLETAESDAPALLAVADESEILLLFSNYGRAFRLPLEKLNEAPVRARGQALADLLPFQVHEQIVAALPANRDKYVALVSERGWARRVRDGYLGPNMLQGMTFHNVKEGGYLVGACWTPGDGDLFIATKQGKAIRFMESQVPTRGVLGLRTQVDDTVVAVTSISSHSSIFLVGSDGKGTIRQMGGFAANKAPGAGGKVAMKADNLIGALSVEESDDILLISRLGKIIRFQADEVPPKEGVVQGVNCMSLRADEVTAVSTSSRQAVTIATISES
jgi:DNA gyrase subunit A